MPVDPKRVQAVFLAAVEHEDPVDRAAVLDHECSADAELRLWVETLLRVLDEPDNPLIHTLTPPGELNPTVTIDRPAPPPVAESLGSRIGPYKPLQKIGEGGMGT